MATAKEATRKRAVARKRAAGSKTAKTKAAGSKAAQAKSARAKATKKAKPKKSSRATTTRTKQAPRSVKRAPARKVAAKRAPAAPAPLAAAAAGPAQPVPDLPPEVLNLALVLDALHDETQTNGGTAAAPRVLLFREKRGDVDAQTFGFVSNLAIRNWYAFAQGKPNTEDQNSLWMTVREHMGRSTLTPNPRGWDGQSATDDLRRIAQRVP